MNILILKTSIENDGLMNELSPFLTSHPHIAKWSVDLEDCDKVLRVETSQLSELELIEFLSVFGIVSCDLDEAYQLES